MNCPIRWPRDNDSRLKKRWVKKQNSRGKGNREKTGDRRKESRRAFVQKKFRSVPCSSAMHKSQESEVWRSAARSDIAAFLAAYGRRKRRPLPSSNVGQAAAPSTPTGKKKNAPIERSCGNDTPARRNAKQRRVGSRNG